MSIGGDLLPDDKDTISFDGSEIAYTVFYSRNRKTACITVYPSGEVKLSVPLRTSQAQARRYMTEKASWVLKKLNAFEAHGCEDATKKYTEGEKFLFQGREYALKIDGGAGPVVTLGSETINAIVPPGLRPEEQTAVVREAVFEWYRFQAEMAIALSMPYYCRLLNVPVPGFRVKNQSKRWGSCTAANFLNFNVKILMAPPEQMDYVIAHELCHVRVKDHSQKYWALLASVMPDYNLRKKALRVDGWKYEL